MTGRGLVSPEPVADPEALAVLERAQADLAGSLRGLLDACLRTRVEGEELTAVAQQARELTDRLLVAAREEPLGLETASDHRVRGHGNAMSGMRNPIAPPLDVTADDEGNVRAQLRLGAAYEGPPGCVHGGILAAVLDQVVGTVPARVGRPGLTAYLNTTYRRPTLLDATHTVTAQLDRVEGWKTFASGQVRDEEGRLTAEAEALFVVPRWAREYIGDPAGDVAPADGSAS
ncbi:PaaI family thioesterase [Janibacter corallicola]|uniref:PaaI family thioesterase n=1 Tax=Janibacter corallicola TaxID=415212 RepID=UPI00082F4802|nr:PaaI family thioesterase [Janibacter corallicola]